MVDLTVPSVSFLSRSFKRFGKRDIPCTRGALGENFTLTGLDWAHIQPGDHMNVGENVRIEFTDFCEPCRRIAQWFHKKDYRRIDQQQYPGWSRLYARVLTEGQVLQGDRVWVENLS